MERDSMPTADLTSGILNVLADNHRRFLAFLRPGVRRPEDAEEILQTAFVRASEKEATIRDDENAVAWFYRLLRNALVDYYRRNAVEQRAIETLAHDAETTVEPDELNAVVCACMHDLIPTLKPEYAELLKRVDLEGATVPAAADELNITANNAGVRLHRARQALKVRLVQTCGTCTTHGCLDCSCKSR
jgi:RNA polymerase sigma-70 factor (ECF subfamily)